MPPVQRMYHELAPWFHLLTPPSHYVDDARFVREELGRAIEGPFETLLELGSGGGNTCSHLAGLRLTLTDRSPAMLALSATINPGAEHLVGDMRTLRLGRTFDAVLVHDAVCYLLTEADLAATFCTAHEHLRPGGGALFMPDHVRERFAPGTDHGGEDEPAASDGRPGRALRYLEWTTDPDPDDTTYQVDFAILTREADGTVAVHHDRHVEGLFPTATWLARLREAGFEPEWVEESETGLGGFVARRGAG